MSRAEPRWRRRARPRLDSDETLPAAELPDLCLRKLKESAVLERAGRSAIYRSRWRQAGIEATRIRTYRDLAGIPFTTTSHLRAGLATMGPAKLAGESRARFWVSTSGTTGAPKWIPVADGDIANILGGVRRMLRMVMDPADDISLLALSAPAPFVSESWFYLTYLGFFLGDRPANAALSSLPESADALEFARRAKSRTLFAFPSIAALIGDQVRRQAAPEARRLFRRKRSWRAFLAMAAARLFPIRARHVFRFRKGFFAGEPLTPYAKNLKRAFNLEAFAAYASTESANVAIIECSSHRGLHVFLDSCLPEIIASADLERERADSAFVPQAVPLWQAEPGLSGELVLTTFAEAFPLVRFRTSDLIRVVGTGPCACGRTHPRILILQRCDDIVNLGLIRFSIYLLKSKLESDSLGGRISQWRLRLTREGVKPKMVLEVKPADPASAGAMRQEILARIDEIEGVGQARKNGLIADPEIRFVAEIGDDRGASGKDKLVIYEPAFFGGM